MGVSTFFGLNIGLNALDTFQQAESVVSNNISNENTPGYVQETANISEGTPFPPAGNSMLAGQLAQGSLVSSVTRQVNAFINQQDRANQGTYQMYSTHSNVLDQIQSILNEPSSNSIQNALDQFFSAWQSLSSDPSSTAARGSVISQAQTLSETYGTVTSQLEQLQSGLVNVVTGEPNTPVYQLSNNNVPTSGLSITLVQPQFSNEDYSVSYTGNTLTLINSNGQQVAATAVSTTAAGTYSLGSPTGVEFVVSIPSVSVFQSGGALATATTLSLHPSDHVYTDGSIVTATSGTLGNSSVLGDITVSGSNTQTANQYQINVSGTASTYTVTLMDASGTVLGTATGSSSSMNSVNIIGTGSATGETFNFVIPTLTTLYTGTSTYSQTDLINTTASQLGGQIGELNQYASQISQLNDQILKVEQSGENPNTLLDQRGAILDNMSKLANISYTVAPFTVTNQSAGVVGQLSMPGAVNVQLGSFSLVSGTTVNQLNYGDLAQLVSNGQITSGSLAGNVQGVQDTQNLLQQFDGFLSGLAQQVNAIQAGPNAYGLSGTSTPPPIFAVNDDASGHVNLSVSITSTDDVAASDSPNQPGNNNNALKMIQLQSATNYNGGTLDQGVAKIVSQVGIEAGSVNDSKSTANALAQQSSTMRQSISGVDTNQQAALMIEYQNSYDAAAKFITTFDQMLQALMNIAT